MNDSEVEQVVSALAKALAQRGWKMATAESCTGGWIAKCCTDLAGSSAWFERGFVTYSNEAKTEMLGVDPHIIEEHGAVSGEVAGQMALGALLNAPVEASLAVTGVAGPEGSEDKPPGTVWFGWAIDDLGVDSEFQHFSGDREAVRRKTVLHALQGLLNRIERA